MKRLILIFALFFSPSYLIADTLEHVEDEVHAALEGIKALQGEINKLKAQISANKKAMSASSKVAKKFSKLSLGGYGELHYNNTETDAGAKTRKMDFHRFVLFVGYDFSPKVRFFSEYELEHSIAGEGKVGEVELEQAYIEYDVTDKLTTRAGMMLLPVGIMNEVHEPTTFYGVERNNVEAKIIPATWWAGGVGVTYKASQNITIDAMFHEGLAVPVSGSSALYIRSGRQKTGNAEVGDMAYTARVKWQKDGLALSAFWNEQTDASANEADILDGASIYGVSAQYTHPSGLELRALHAEADLDVTDSSSSLVTNGFDEQEGSYLLASYRIDDTWGIFAEWESVEAYSASNEFDQYRVGFNMYWDKNAVIKFDYVDHEKDASSTSDFDGFNVGMGYDF